MKYEIKITKICRKYAYASVHSHTNTENWYTAQILKTNLLEHIKDAKLDTLYTVDNATVNKIEDRFKSYYFMKIYKYTDTTVEETTKKVESTTITEEQEITLTQALANFANRRGYKAIHQSSDCIGAGLKADVIRKNVRYYDYKRKRYDEFLGYSTVADTYNAKTKTIDLIYRNIVVKNFRVLNDNCVDRSERYNIIVKNARQIYDALRHNDDFDIFFNNFDFDAKDAFSYFLPAEQEQEQEQEKASDIKNNSEKSEPIPAVEEETTKEEPQEIEPTSTTLEPTQTTEEEAPQPQSLSEEARKLMALLVNKYDNGDGYIDKNVVERLRTSGYPSATVNATLTRMKKGIQDRIKKAGASVTLLDALVNFANRRGYIIKHATDDHDSVKILVDVVLKNVKYEDYKTTEAYSDFSTLAGTYCEDTKTVDLVSTRVSIVSVSSGYSNSILFTNAKQIKKYIFDSFEDFDKFFNNFDFDAKDAFSYFLPIEGTPSPQETPVIVTEDSQKSEPIVKPIKTSKAKKIQKYDRAKIMARAWAIRKATAIELGCKVSDVSMSTCLKMAWQEAKSNNLTLQQPAK